MFLLTEVHVTSLISYSSSKRKIFTRTFDPVTNSSMLCDPPPPQTSQKVVINVLLKKKKEEYKSCKNIQSKKGVTAFFFIFYSHEFKQSIFFISKINTNSSMGNLQNLGTDF